MMTDEVSRAVMDEVSRAVMDEVSRADLRVATLPLEDSIPHT